MPFPILILTLRAIGTGTLPAPTEHCHQPLDTPAKMLLDVAFAHLQPLGNFALGQAVNLAQTINLLTPGRKRGYGILKHLPFLPPFGLAVWQGLVGCLMQNLQIANQFNRYYFRMTDVLKQDVARYL